MQLAPAAKYGRPTAKMKLGFTSGTVAEDKP